MTLTTNYSKSLSADMPIVEFRSIYNDGNMVVGLATIPLIMYLNDEIQEVKSSARPILARNERSRRRSENPMFAAAYAKARTRIGNWMIQENAQTFGLAALRLKAGLSQSQLASRIGTQQSNVSRMEKGQTDVQLSTMRRIAQALGTTIEEVAGVMDSQVGASHEL